MGQQQGSADVGAGVVNAGMVELSGSADHYANIPEMLGFYTNHKRTCVTPLWYKLKG